jgi:hypothetical protein
LHGSQAGALSNVPSQRLLFACGRLVRATASPKSTDTLGKSKAYDSRAVLVQLLAERSDSEKVNGMAGRVERSVNQQAASRALTRMGFDAALKKVRAT